MLQTAAANLQQLGRIQAWQADISDRQATLKLVKRIASDLIDVNYLVNAAGVFLPQSFLDHAEADTPLHPK